MFQLIIAILSIALIATLAIASVYYGGDAFTEGTAKAGASTIVSQAQQVSAADVLYQNDNAGAHAPDVATLVTENYLQAAPQMPANVGGNLELDSASGVVFGTVANEAICEKVNLQLGVDTIPTATSADAADLATAITEQYGCASVDDGAGSMTYVFAYK